jgi:hypothetical protein
MRKVKILLIVTLAVCQVTACASPGNRAALESYQRGCANGDANACRMVPHQESINRAEAGENAGKAALVALLLPILVLAAVADAKTQPVYVVCRPRWAC